MDIQELIAQLQGGGQDAQDLINVLTDLLRADGKSQFIRDSEHAIQTRILSEGLTVTTDVNSVGRDVIGTSQFDTLNFVSAGGVVRVNAANPRQADIPRGAGGGADCLFDYLVSSCFATLSGFSEGQTFTSLSGCTFKGYSTIQGAETAVEAAAVPAVVAICGGTYVENVTLTQNASMNTHFFGTGRTRVLINPSTGSAFTYGGGVAAANEVSFTNIGFSKPFTFASAQSLTNCRFTECNFQNIDGTAGAAQSRYAVGVKMIRCNVSGSIAFTSTAGGALFDFETWQMTDCNVTGIVSNIGSGGGGTVTGSLDFLGGTYAGGFNLESSGTGGNIRFGGGIQISGTILAGANAIRLSENAIAGLVMSGVLLTSTIMSGPTMLLTSAGGLNAEFNINDVNFTGVNTNGYIGTGAGEVNRGLFQGCTFPVNNGASTKVTATTSVFGNTTFGPNSPDIMSYASVTTSSGGNAFYTGGTIPSGGSSPFTEHHTVNCVVDGTVTNQKTVVGPMPLAGTITASKAKTCDAIAIGATPWIGQAYLIPAANINTDGGTTTIYSTAPSITNGNMRSSNDVLSVTTFAAGDYFAFATTQVGTSATMIQMGLTVTYP